MPWVVGCGGACFRCRCFVSFDFPMCMFARSSPSHAYFFFLGLAVPRQHGYALCSVVGCGCGWAVVPGSDDDDDGLVTTGDAAAPPLSGVGGDPATVGGRLLRRAPDARWQSHRVSCLAFVRRANKRATHATAARLCG